MGVMTAPGSANCVSEALIGLFMAAVAVDPARTPTRQSAKRAWLLLLISIS